MMRTAGSHFYLWLSVFIFPIHNSLQIVWYRFFQCCTIALQSLFQITLFLLGHPETINVINLKKQEATVKEQLAILEQENSDLLATKNKLEDPNYVTTYARGEYMFSKGDEKLFRLPSKGE